ncbi:Zinc protease PQQL-like [Bienertia sinuspersici]
MDLLPAETPELAKKHGFRSLKLLNINMDQPLAETPFAVDYGKLDNGLTYYVRSNSKPKMRAALALVVKVGSVLEEEDERGVAHIVEHLAFNATTKYTNHDIVKFLESIGAEFGACQNAMTSADDTVYELFVPVDKPELLSQAISVLAEFSTEIRVSAEDLEKERGAVMEEYRGSRNANGRMQDSHWALMMAGSKSVVELIRMHFEQKSSAHETPDVPRFPVPAHEEPRFSLMISCKMPAQELKTIKDYRDLLVESMFLQALNQRLFKVSRRRDPPFYSCSAAADVLVSPIKAYIMTSSCKENGTIEALEAMLMELARIQLHGFSEREISIVRALLLSEIESAYLERDQIQSTSLRDEYVQHFLCNEPVVGIEFEAQLQKSLLPCKYLFGNEIRIPCIYSSTTLLTSKNHLVAISATEVATYAQKLCTAYNCVIKAIEPQATVTVDDLKDAVAKITCLKEGRSILAWDEDQIPEEIVNIKPNPGSVDQQQEYSDIKVTELILSNGMRVCYKCTDFLDDQVLISGYSYGGLSELSESDYFSCSMGSTIAGEIGIFGHKPSVLMDMLAGKRAEVGTKLGPYMRSFSADCSPTDLETALQLVYQLFTTNVEPGEEEVKKVMEMAEEAVRAQERDPYTAFANRVREISYGNSYFFRPIRISDLKKVDAFKACDYFSNSFKDPSTFTAVIVGNINPSIARPLILQYLGGIPKPHVPILKFNRDDLKGLPFTFPGNIIREVVRRPMVEAQCSVQLCFPVELKNGAMIEEIHFVGFLSKLLETKMMQVLRFKHGQIYSAAVSVFLGGNKPSRTGDVRGDISINFSCDPSMSSTLVDLALDEILCLQNEGPLDEDISAILEIEQRAHENGLQENYYWLDKILRSYQSRVYSGDIGSSFQIHEESRLKVRESLTPSASKSALQRILPFPCRKKYTAVILMPQASRYQLLKSYLRKNYQNTKVLLGIAGLTVLTVTVWRYSRSSINGERK